MPYEAYFDKDQRWIYHVSSFLILPVWINLMLLVGRLPRLGCYSLMFTTVLQNFLKVYIYTNIINNISLYPILYINIKN